ncbi:MAG: DUF362 domain-containing protein [Candidatus Aenigmatarchaeota archaeon]
MDKVYIVKGKDPYKTTKELLSKMNFSLKGKKVFIKTNVHPLKIPSTDVGVVRAIVERLDGCKVTIGGNAGITGESFIINGYEKLAKDYNLNLIDLDRDEKVYVKVKKPLRFREMPIAKSALDNDYVINAAKLKIHSLWKVTLCLKNLFGCVSGRTKILMHPHIDEAIHDYMQFLRSDLNIIDGIVGNQNDEFFPNPIRSNIMIGGHDILSVDVVGASCMGVDPQEVRYLNLLSSGTKNIEVVGEKIENVIKKYDTRRRPIRTVRFALEDALRMAVRLNLISR